MRKQIQNLINSPSWGFWQFIVALIGLAVAYNIFFLQKQDKQLQISYSVSSVVEINQDLESQIEMSLHGLPFSDIAIIEYKIENVGDVPIVKSDFVEPIIFSVSPDWNVVGISLDNREYGTGTYDMTFDPEGESQGLPLIHKVKITPALLNPTEGWRGKFVIITNKVGSPVNFDVYSHIIGISKLEKVDLTDVHLSQNENNLRQIGIGIFLGVLISMLVLSASRFVAYIRKFFAKNRSK